MFLSTYIANCLWFLAGVSWVCDSSCGEESLCVFVLMVWQMSHCQLSSNHFTAKETKPLGLSGERGFTLRR